MREIKCNQHPNYLGVYPPRKTKLYPEGCSTCWKKYYQVNTKQLQNKKDVVVISTNY